MKKVLEIYTEDLIRSMGIGDCSDYFVVYSDEKWNYEFKNRFDKKSYTKEGDILLNDKLINIENLSSEDLEFIKSATESLKQGIHNYEGLIGFSDFEGTMSYTHYQLYKKALEYLDEFLKRDEKLIKVAKICVDCEKNDIVDIKCGGPEYLGFDFNVSLSELEELKIFIKSEIEKKGLPIDNIYSYNQNYYLPKEKVWTRERIRDCIKQGY